MMNERIRKLAKQADKWAAEEFHQLFLDNINADRQELFNKKFAELIVKECADVAVKFHLAHPYSVEYQVKKHFGVES
jgi:hypothetical protein